MVEAYQNLGRITPYNGKTVEDRIYIMFMQVAKSIRDPLARTLYAQATSGCPERDDWCEVQAVYWFVRNHLRYTGDVRGLDTYQSLARSWQLRAADCDDFSIVYNAILTSGGFRTGVMIVAHDGATYNHVLGVVELPRNEARDGTRHILGLDGTVPNATPGWFPPGFKNMKPRIFWYGEKGQDE